jgi:sugar phosphate isomerase/epimerase
VKDVDEQRRWAIIGQGTIDYAGQFRALATDGYDGAISIETHYVHPEGGKERATYECYPGLITALRMAGVTLSRG